jgi:hypothetical protein
MGVFISLRASGNLLGYRDSLMPAGLIRRSLSVSSNALRLSFASFELSGTTSSTSDPYSDMVSTADGTLDVNSVLTLESTSESTSERFSPKTHVSKPLHCASLRMVDAGSCMGFGLESGRRVVKKGYE